MQYTTALYRAFSRKGLFWNGSSGIDYQISCPRLCTLISHFAKNSCSHSNTKSSKKVRIVSLCIFFAFLHRGMAVNHRLAKYCTCFSVISVKLKFLYCFSCKFCTCKSYWYRQINGVIINGSYMLSKVMEVLLQQVLTFFYMPSVIGKNFLFPKSDGSHLMRVVVTILMWRKNNEIVLQLKPHFAVLSLVKGRKGRS